METTPLTPNSHKVTLDTKLESLKSVTSKFVPKLEKLGLITVRDLLWHFPVRYEDYRTISKIKDLKEGRAFTVRAEVRRINVRRAWGRNLYIVEATLTDETGGINAVWFNQPFLTRVLKEGMTANFAGKILTSKRGMFLSNPSYELLRGSSQTKHTAGLIPVYGETRGFTSKGVRHLTNLFLDIIGPTEDFIPSRILEEYNLPSLSRALKHIHFPKTNEQADLARKRFSFEYLFLLQLNNLLFRQQLSKEASPSLAINDREFDRHLNDLAFTLTPSQQKSLKEVMGDIMEKKPMNRLLQGDVGSGKTVVAALAALIAAHSDHQAVFMAPTEVLARQHYKTFTTMFKKVDMGVCLLTGSEARVYFGAGLEQKKTKVAVKKLIANGELKIIIGTHALIADNKKEKISFPKLGFVVVDEQHRFGVKQRAALLGSKGKGTVPHFLSMSATPIPRTLTLTVFGDLDLSTINELPRGRKPIVTKIVDPLSRAKAYGFIKEHLKKGRQAFFIYPRISMSQSNEEDGEKKDKRKLAWSEVKNVEEEYQLLSEKIFPDFKVGMLHGKMKPAEKKKIMQEFSENKLHVLASTSVIEVGVDIPNATIMVIEGADRFGLAQLYQFRGRVGRGEHQSFCLLFTDSKSETTHARLTALLEARNGFELAEKDLALRGPGEFLGERQTGVPDNVMNALSDIQLIKLAQDAAKTVLREDPGLTHSPLLAQKIALLRKDIHLE